MRFRKIDTNPSGGGLMPLIQIVFLLLALFMIAVNLENTKADERMKLPKDMLAKPAEVKLEHELVLNFRYERDPERRSAVPMVTCHQRSVGIEDLSPVLEQEKQILVRRHGADVIHRVTVLIRADSKVPAGLVQQLAKKCQEHGFSRFSMRETSEDR